MPTPAEIEQLFAAVGLGPILAARPTLHRYQLEKAANMPAVIRRRIASWLGNSTFAPAKDVPPFDYEEVLGQVSQKQTPEQTAALFAAVPDRELATELGVRAGAILNWAFDTIPREEPAGPIGIGMDPPSQTSIADFRRAWQVALDPLIVLGDLEDGSLSEDQVATLKLVYREIYALIRQAVTEAKAQIIARRGKKWQPAPAKVALLGILLEQSDTDPELTAQVQAAYAQEEAELQQGVPAPRRRRPSGSNEGDAALTPGQEAAASA